MENTNNNNGIWSAFFAYLEELDPELYLKLRKIAKHEEYTSLKDFILDQFKSLVEGYEDLLAAEGLSFNLLKAL